LQTEKPENKLNSMLKHTMSFTKQKPPI